MNEQTMDPVVYRRGMLLAGALLALLAGAEIAAILFLNGGHFTYTLDDPYIHLSLAENLIHGHYGVNMTEPSAPSSSILWAFLLAPLAATGAGVYMPLFINLVCAVLIAVVFGEILRRCLPACRSALVFGGCVALLTVTFNTFGLVFTGMEHTLQVLLAATILLGLIREGETGKVPAVLVVAIVVAPLVRYECMAISMGAIAYLLWRRQFRAAGVAVVAIAVCLGAFTAFLLSLGLEALPTSVIAKSQVAENRTIGSTLVTLRDALKDYRGIVLTIVALTLFSLASNRYAAQPRRALAFAVAAAIGFHLLLGRYGSYHRYEIYIWSVAMMAMLYLFRHGLASFYESQGPWRFSALAVVWAIALHAPYLQNLITTPLAANNIYEQHYQMHRLAIAYGEPVGVNDLGYVAFGNPQFVLDLGGLASLEALSHRQSSGSEWLESLTTRYNVRLVMIYDDWFRKIPAGWHKVAKLTLGKPRVTPAGSVVSVYVTDADTGRVAPLLAKFEKTLPRGVKFTRMESQP